VRVVLRQGIKRQIRLMFYKVGYEVTRLTRIRIGGLTAKGMKPGDWKELAPRDLALLESKRK
jgi:16S rRNA U516 pseudouridylate synthase RsuA-like enzyme